MPFQVVGYTTQGHALERTVSAQTRVILVPHGSRVGEDDRILSIEQDIIASIDAVGKEIRPTSPHLQIHGVELEPGISSDFLVVNRYSKTKKACLHAMAHPELGDQQFLRMLCSKESGIMRVLLVSQSALFSVELSTVDATSREFELTTCLENTGGDFFGSVIDYLRGEFGEDMVIQRIKLLGS